MLLKDKPYNNFKQITEKKTKKSTTQIYCSAFNELHVIFSFTLCLPRLISH